VQTTDTTASERQARLARRAKTSNDRAAKTAPQPFIHQPVAPYVPLESEYCTQRSFSRGNVNRGVDLSSAKKKDGWGDRPTSPTSFAEVSVFRWADVDAAELRLSVNLGRSENNATVECTAAELREIAARLLDAAHDLEVNPSDKLSRRAA
jgi:hypothetical protein